MMKYKRESEYQTEIGGIVTIIVVMGLLGYFSFTLVNTVKRNTFMVSNFIEKVNLANTDYNIQLTKDTFDIGMSVLYAGTLLGIQERIDEYF